MSNSELYISVIERLSVSIEQLKNSIDRYSSNSSGINLRNFVFLTISGLFAILIGDWILRYNSEKPASIEKPETIPKSIGVFKDLPELGLGKKRAFINEITSDVNGKIKDHEHNRDTVKKAQQQLSIQSFYPSAGEIVGKSFSGSICVDDKDVLKDVYFAVISNGLVYPQLHAQTTPVVGDCKSMLIPEGTYTIGIPFTFAAIYVDEESHKRAIRKWVSVGNRSGKWPGFDKGELDEIYLAESRISSM